MAAKVMYGDEVKDSSETIWKECCLSHGKGELLPAHRAVLICKTKDSPNGHKPVYIFNSLDDKELLYHVVSKFFLTILKTFNDELYDRFPF